MREINVSKITSSIREMFIKMNYQLSDDVCSAISKSEELETNPLAKDVLSVMEENLLISKEEGIPICQDTGMAIVFMEIGQEVLFVGGDIEEAINLGVRQAYAEGFLRKSVVSDPILRENTKDNTPAVIYYKIVSGSHVLIKCAAKGFGSENMSQIKMLKPSDGVSGIIDFVIETVKNAGPNACPPITIGVGIGGTMDKAALLSKEALLRPLNQHNNKPHIRDLEIELFEKINRLGIGPQGFGGDTTSLGISIETYPTHIAGLPVAVNINCHVSRHLEMVI